MVWAAGCIVVIVKTVANPSAADGAASDLQTQAYRAVRLNNSTSPADVRPPSGKTIPDLVR